jgi:group I intron endonuclease
MMLVYQATNLSNGKVYVGQTTDSLQVRIRRHLSYGSQHFPRALRKYGLNSFRFTIIDTASTQEELDAKERDWIAKLNCQHPLGYNLTAGGGGASGWKASDETKAKISAAKIGKTPMTQEGKMRLAEYRRTHPASLETRHKLSAALTGRVFSATHRQRLSESHLGHQQFLGRKHTPETIAKMRAAQKGRVISPEHREKLRIANLGKRASIEARLRMSAAHRAAV